MEFIKAFQENPVFTDTALGYHKLVTEGTYERDDRPELLRTGAITQDNGDILFRLYAPEASSVRVVITIDKETPDVELKKQENGFFEGVLKYDPRLAGAKTVNFYVDGAYVIHPFVPVFYWLGRPANYIEVPDPEEMFLLERKIPRGSVTRDYFWSETMDEWESCLVYTPPCYGNGEKYPVLYLQHGHTENEVSWVYNGKVPYIMDNLIADGKIEPMIVVMNDGMVRKPGEPSFCYDSFEHILLNDCLPFIEQKYSVYTDKWHRAMAGLSMGSAQTSCVAFAHPELFAYAGLFSGFLALLANEIPLEECPHLEIMKDPERFSKEFRVFYRCIGANDGLKTIFDNDEKFLKAHGIDRLPNYHSTVYENRFHDWGIWRLSLKEFAELLFK